MPRGGHGKVGPVAFDAATRDLHGTRARARHRVKGDVGTPMVVCDPPPGLSKAETQFWRYYAPQLVAEHRLSMKARDTLAKYCTALAVVAGLRRQLGSRKRSDLELRADHRKELRQWLLAARLYENDLLLNPASSIRAPKADVGGDGPAMPNDPLDEFDDKDDGAVN